MTTDPTTAPSRRPGARPPAAGAAGSLVGVPEENGRVGGEPRAAAVEKEALRTVMGQYATGAAVVTGTWAGEPYGMAVNSFTSVSLVPPMILFCPDKRSATWPGIWRSGHFTVNILGCDHGDLCRRFAKKGEDRFADVAWYPAPTGSPVLAEAVAFLECRIERVHDAGDHFITVGRVLDLGVQREAPPLVFYQGRFHRLHGVDGGAARAA